MSLLNTLAKVAIGVAVAKGASTLARSARSGKGGGASASSGGLEDIMGGLLGGGSARTASSGRAGSGSGSLGDLLNELGGAGTSSTSGRGAIRSTRSGAPDLGAVLGQLVGGGAGRSATGRSATGRGTAGSSSGSATGGLASGGLGEIIGALATAGAAGGLGGLVGGMISGRAAAGQAGSATSAGAQSGLGGLGGLLNAALGGETPEAAPEQELAAGLLLKAMIQAAKADGQIDQDEQAKLLSKLGDVTDQEKAFVQQELAAPVDPEGLAKQIPQGMEAQAYAVSLMAIDLDTQEEGQYLDRLAKALGLAPEAVNQIHAQAGAPALYA